MVGVTMTSVNFMEQHWCDIRYAGFLKLIAIFANAILSRTQRVHVDLFFFQNPMSGTNLPCFTNVLQCYVTVFKRVTIEKDVIMTSQLSL